MSVRLDARVSPSEVPFGPVVRSVMVKLTARVAAAAGPARPLNLGLILDKSASMVADTPAGRPTKLDAAKAAAERVVAKLRDADTFTLIAFNDQPEVLAAAVPVGPNRASLVAAIRRMEARSETHVSRALRATFDAMTPAARPGVTSAMYLLTDGFAHDPDASVALAQEIHKAKRAVYAGGVGEQYSHAFLEKLCADPVEQGRFLVDHVPTENLGGLAVAFEQYLARRGHVAAADCRLTVEPAAGVQLQSGTAEEHALALAFQGNTAAVPDLPARGEPSYELKLTFTPNGDGPVRLARFVLRYAGADGRPAEAATVATIAVNRTPGAKPVPDKEVDDLVRRILAIKMQTKAALAVEAGDVPKAVGLIRQSTRVYKELGMSDRADDLTRRADELERADASQLDAQVKKLRQATKVYSEPAPPAGR